MRSTTGTIIAAALLATLAGCSTDGPQNDQLVVGNAIDADTAIMDNADDQADELDERSAELDAAADRATGNGAAALRAESRDDLAEAADVRASGERRGAAASDQIEAQAGLLNEQ